MRTMLMWLWSRNKFKYLLILQFFHSSIEFIYSILFSLMLSGFIGGQKTYSWIIDYIIPFTIFYLITSILSTYLTNKYAHLDVFEYTDHLVNKAFKNYQIILHNDKSEINNLFTVEVYRLIDKVYVPSLLIFGKSLVILSISAFLLYTNTFKFVSFLLSIFIVIFVTNLPLKSEIRRIGKLITTNNSDRLEVINSFWENFIILKFFNLSKKYQNKINHISNTAIKLRSKLNTLNLIPRYVLESFIFLFLLGLLYYNPEDISKLVLFIFLLVRILPLTNQVYYSINEVKSNMHIIEILQKKKNAKQSKINFKENGKNLIHCKNLKIFLPNKTLSYDEIIIEKGKHYCLQGDSGKGKSTLVKTFSGLITTYTGQLEFDLEDSLIDSVSYCDQNSLLLNDSLKNNIIGGLIQNEERLSKVFDICELYDICSLQDIDTIKIKNYGENLSGGQIQRISLARSIYKDCTVYIFDESTSSIPEQQQLRILNKINLFLKKKTLIMIAHRQSVLEIYPKTILI